MAAERKPIDRRKQIIDAASKSFAMFGYKATTMELVAKLGGVGKGTIYTFFATKEVLFEEIVKQMTAEMKAIANASIDRKKPFFDNLNRALHGVLQFREQHELFVKLNQELWEVRTPTVQDGLAQIERAVVNFIEQEVRIGIQQGELRSDNPELTAYLIFRTYIALAVEWGRTREPLSREAVSDHMTTLFRYGLSGEPEATT
ncbi:TetR/AcrR family transcriptional regulator [Paenibacillus radicis (ex Gao et al. 2016)]|uniref:TetR family transcriptional regulator n=1 Tax=Paenibacillus radicis (ex Gao et al. 2016) TaxID=1737354 RepID=A0A917LWE2_9BACL|nr:TetR/AcrR family transcriptional regulator [Paenibacillus radicis (ex Gao et al. 2016)]GGG63194.1 TetR family transcriptional regulator [Paenibacillus radicis (ex Gao et al. 2016)]